MGLGLSLRLGLGDGLSPGPGQGIRALAPIVKRAPFRARSYSCDSKEIFLGMLVTVQNLTERLDKRAL